MPLRTESCHLSRLSASIIGRRTVRISVGPLDDQEFQIALKVLSQRGIGFMLGAVASPELRQPWILRAISAPMFESVNQPPPGQSIALAPLLSVDLIRHARRRFSDPELRRLFKAIATSLLADSKDNGRDASLLLESFQVNVVRRETLKQYLSDQPFPQPSSNLSQPYTNPEGVSLNACVFCGFCERFACEHCAKSVPQTIILPVLMKNKNFELRTGCQVQCINLDSTGKKATGVTYIDSAGREFEQPASLVITSSFALNNVRRLLLSKIGRPYDPASGRGVMGRNYAYQTMSSVTAFFDENVNINPFMAAGASGTLINDFAGDNFDHSKHGFIGGAYIGAVNTNGRPIRYHPVPPATPRWGAKWKQAVVKHYNDSVILNLHGSSMSQKQNYLDLDPTYKDAWGQPLLRIAFDFPANDLRMADFVTKKGVEIGKAMDAKEVAGSARKGPCTVTQYQTTHNGGGGVIGHDPHTSVLNPYLQCWDVHNVFVIGGSAFPRNASWNPTGTVGALTYWAIDALKSKYLKNPGRLVDA